MMYWIGFTLGVIAGSGITATCIGVYLNFKEYRDKYPKLH